MGGVERGCLLGVAIVADFEAKEIGDVVVLKAVQFRQWTMLFKFLFFLLVSSRDVKCGIAFVTPNEYECARQT